jgi:hypothetical protein
MNDPKVMALRLMALALTKPVNGGDPQLLMATRQSLEEADLSVFDAEELAFVVEGARACSRFAESDDRANGLYMLLHLAEHDRTRHAVDDVFESFKLEADRHGGPGAAGL